MHVDAYGLRHSKLEPMLDDEHEFRIQMSRYTLEFYHTIIRRPMLKFKKNIISQIAKRQDQERCMKEIKEETAAKEAEYEREKVMEFEHMREEIKGNSKV